MSASPEIRIFLQELSQAWLNRKYDDLNRFFRSDVIFVLPGLSASIEGRSSAVSSYTEFMERSQISEYSQEVVSVNAWKTCANAVMSWYMVWESGGKRHEERGKDIYTLLKVRNGWEIAWRATIPQQNN